MARRKTVKTTKKYPETIIAGSKFWLVAMGTIFVCLYSLVAYRVADISLNISGKYDAYNENRKIAQKDRNDDRDITSLINLVKEGATIKNLKISGSELDLENIVILPRANIVDRNGVILATSLETASLYANPQEIKEAEEVAQLLSEKVAGIKYDKAYKLLSSKRKFVWLKRNLTPKEQYEVNRLGIPGLYFQKEYARSYPHGNLFSHILGFVSVDNKGLSGVEKYYDDVLRKNRKIGGTLLSNTASNREENSLKLSLDTRLQYLVREELLASMKEFKAIGASGIVMHIPTGEILSMVSLPDFNPNQVGKAKPAELFNRATLGVYELGSIFKTFTMAMGLEYGAIEMNSGYDVTKPIRIARFSIRDSHPRKGWLSIPEIFAYSSNIGTVKVAMEVGAEKQKDFMQSLGLFDIVDIEIPERGRPLYPKKWRNINMMTISYGHGISVSPMHMVQAMGSIINDGKKIKPTIVAKEKKRNDYLLINDASGGISEFMVNSANSRETVVSKETSRKVRRLMRAAVQYGTGRKADVIGYRVGGKTGTAEKNKSGKYDKDKKIVSFIGAFPMDKPEYLILVVIDEPKGNKKTYGYATGGWIAAPVVGNIISKMAAMLAINPVFIDEPDAIDIYWRRKHIEARKKRKRQLHSASF